MPMYTAETVHSAVSKLSKSQIALFSAITVTDIVAVVVVDNVQLW